MDREFHDIVSAASRRPEVHDAIRQLYDDLELEVQRRQPVCALSGRCCRFEDFGHRLFVTTLELAAFLLDYRDLPKPPALIDAITEWDGTGCPFQVAKLCGVHTLRPFGCRIFFCDPTAAQWQTDHYESFHAQLKRLHDQLAVPYHYLEWRQALDRLGLTGRSV